jgi:uroporphyrinogen-III synthase
VSLRTKRILVTRPRHLATRICELIESKDGECVLFPTIDIQPIISSDELSKLFNNINVYDIVIFVSRNAVICAFDHYIDSFKLPEKLNFIAIGGGTAEALTERNLADVLHAGEQADSESLLQLPELQTELIQGKTILIVRGVGGREYLADNLKARGAIIEYAEVYKRCLPEYGIQERHKIWQDIKPDAVLVTSSDGLENLIQLTLENDRNQLFNTPLVCMSKRIMDLGKASGFNSRICVVKDKNDKGLLSALLELVGD